MKPSVSISAVLLVALFGLAGTAVAELKIGRASCRERV